MSERLKISAEDLLAKVSKQREDCTLCDITLQAEGRSFPAHRNILVAASDHFEDKFRRNTRNKPKVMDLDEIGVPASGLEIIIDCLYNLYLNVTPENLKDVIIAAFLLQFKCILHLCEEYIRDNPTELETRCLELLQLCVDISLPDSRDELMDLLTTNFERISKLDSFLDLTKEVLEDYIENYQLGTEIEIYHAVIGWIKHDIKLRKCHTAEVISHIRMHDIPMADLVDELLKEPLIQDTPECTVQFKQALKYHASLFEQPLLPVIPPRGDLGLFFMHHQRCSGSMYSLNSEREYRTSGFPKIEPRTSNTFNVFGSNIISVGNFVFLFGTCGSGGHSNEAFAKRYDVNTDTWISISTKPQNVAKSTAVLHGDEIYLIGGEYNDFRSYGRYDVGFLRYSIPKNLWERIAGKECPGKFVNMLACSNNNCVYVTAGEDDKNYNRKMWCYVSNKIIWRQKAKLLHVHNDGVLKSYGDQLFIFGGLMKDGRRNETMELYNVETNQWSRITDVYNHMNLGLAAQFDHAVSFIVDNKKYIFRECYEGDERHKFLMHYSCKIYFAEDQPKPKRYVTIIDLEEMTITDKEDILPENEAWKFPHSYVVCPVRVPNSDKYVTYDSEFTDSSDS